MPLVYSMNKNREDRDANVIINWINIFPTAYSQLLENPAASDDHGTYDFRSIMHYGTNAYAINPTIPTITPVNPANTIAPASDLTPGDIAAIKFLYRNITVQPPPIVFDPPPITKTPPSFNVTVPGFIVHVSALTVNPPRPIPSYTINPPDIQVPATQISANPAPITVDPPPITVTPPPVSV